MRWPKRDQDLQPFSIERSNELQIFLTASLGRNSQIPVISSRLPSPHLRCLLGPRLRTALPCPPQRGRQRTTRVVRDIPGSSLELPAQRTDPIRRQKQISRSRGGHQDPLEHRAEPTADVSFRVRGRSEHVSTHTRFEGRVIHRLVGRRQSLEDIQDHLQKQRSSKRFSGVRSGKFSPTTEPPESLPTSSPAARPE